jgi:hypothetical protein
MLSERSFKELIEPAASGPKPTLPSKGQPQPSAIGPRRFLAKGLKTMAKGLMAMARGLTARVMPMVGAMDLIAIADEQRKRPLALLPMASGLIAHGCWPQPKGRGQARVHVPRQRFRDQRKPWAQTLRNK